MTQGEQQQGTELSAASNAISLFEQGGWVIINPPQPLGK
jgi:hypothetical protein